MSQSAFHTALLAPDAPVPDGLVDPKGRPAGKRFDVYRNNVVVSLSEALAEAFPVVQKLVGEEFFTAMAGHYVRTEPPRDPRIATWGASFPAFLEGFPPVAHIAYLPDIARLEQALRESYHAADSTPADPAQITPQSGLSLAPALRAVASRYPIHAIWAYARGEGPKPEAQAQSVLITRPGYDPHLTP
ncbi:HvfC/BufC N-terminal domain-containing protein, partial [Vannielia litorea]|uniref:HvfC/BufC N-terminal domain-containing protein n=1 Tax=Vannielia litorea TaxID=1217970 RepID=UPI001BCFBCC1